MSSFGEILKKLREKNKLKQEDLAELIGSTKSTISQYETGKREPDLDKLILFADYFNVTTDYLLGRTAKINNNNKTYDNISNKFGAFFSSFFPNEKNINFTKDTENKFNPHRHDHASGYIQCISEAQFKYPDDPIAQLEHIKKSHNDLWYAMALAEVGQRVFSRRYTYKKISFDSTELDYLYRGILDALNHLQRNLPEGVHRYIVSRIDSFTYSAIEKVLANRYIRKDFFTFFSYSSETMIKFEQNEWQLTDINSFYQSLKEGESI